MKQFIQMLVLLFLLLCVMQTVRIQQGLFVPVSIKMDVEQEDPLVVTLRKLNVTTVKTQQIARDIRMACAHTSVNPVLYACLLSTESNFNSHVVSTKGYKGISQSSRKGFDFTSVDILNGAENLSSRLKEANGNTLIALSRYKGGNKGEHLPQAVKQARHVLKIYQSL